MNRKKYPRIINKNIYSIPRMKHCPFCARTDMEITQFQEDVFSISCKCGAESPSDSKSIRAIVAKWNRRRNLDRLIYLIAESDIWYWYVKMQESEDIPLKKKIIKALKKIIIALQYEKCERKYL